jgi:hypothetical protein
VDEYDVPSNMMEDRWYGNPLKNTVHITYRNKKNRKTMHHHSENDPKRTMEPDLLDEDHDFDEMARGYQMIEFNSLQLEGMNAALGTFVYYNTESKARLVLKRKGSSSTGTRIDFEKLAKATVTPAGTVSPDPDRNPIRVTFI